MKTKILLITILLAAFFLRVISIDNLPPSPNWDEVSLGYNSYSILKTAKDEWGTTLPLIFRAYGDYKLPSYSYLSLPFIALFGLNSFSVKLLSILAGTTLVYISFLITYKLTSSKKTSLLAAALVAFSPWSIFLSRIALESNLYLLFFSLTFYFLITKRLSLSSIFLALSLFTYNSSRVIFPFLLLLLVIFQIKDSKTFSFKKYLPLILALLVLAGQMLNQSGQARYKWVSLLDQGAINQINELQSQYPRILVNKATFFTYLAVKNYLSHFNPNFLFINGSTNYQFNLQSFYLLYPLLLPLFLIGLFYLLKNYKKLEHLSLLFLLLASPLPSAITRDAPHTLRSITFIFISTLLVALSTQAFKSKKIFSQAVTLIIIISLALSQYQFWPKYKDYSLKYSQSWQYGYQEMTQVIKDNYLDYDQIIVTKKYAEPHEFILFYWPWNPAEYQNDPNKVSDYHADWYWVDAFDKFIFLNDWELKEKTQSPKEKTLLITSPDNYNQDIFTKIQTIYFKDGSPAFDILKHE